MAWSDAIYRLAEAAGLKKPAVTPEPAVKDKTTEATEKADMGPRIGSSGQLYTSGLFQEEYHGDLDTFADRVARFNELRIGDSVIAAQLLRLETPILQARWVVEPPAEDEPLPSEKAAQEALEAEETGAPPKKPSTELEPRKEPEPFGLAEMPVEEPEDEDALEEQDPAELAKQDAHEKALRLIKANVLGDGPKEYRVRQTWRQMLHEAMTARAFGFAIFERTYRRAEGPLGPLVVLDGLWWMHPRSIDRWHVDRNGELLGVIQRSHQTWYEGTGEDAKQTWEYVDKYIPASRLIIFTRNKEGAHVEGVGTIRHVYADAKHAAFLRKAIRIDASKRAIGIPRVTLTGEASPEVKSLAVQQARRMRTGDERLFVVDTPGVTTGFVDMQANTLDVSDHMRGAEDRIRMAHATEWAALGSAGAGGSYSAGDIQSRYFNLVLEADAEWLRETFQSQVIEPLNAINFGGPAPTLRVYDVSPREVTPILEAKKAALLTWTDEDEQDLRRQLRLRQLTEEELAAREEKKKMGEALAAMAVGADPEAVKPGEGKEGKGKPPAPAPSPAAAMPKELAATKAKRAPTPWEERYYPMQQIEDARDAVTRDLILAIRSARESAVREAVAKAVLRDGRIVIGRLKRKSLEEVIRQAIERAREAGRETMREEVRRQVSDITDETRMLAEPPPFDPFTPAARSARQAASAVNVKTLVREIDQELEVLTTLNVDRMLGSIAQAVSRAVLQHLSEGIGEDEAKAEALRDVLESGKAESEAIARESVNRAIVNGRAEVAEQSREALEESGLAVEVARRTHVGEDQPCEECVALDGATFVVGSPEYWANFPPSKCLGGSFCHCQYVYEVSKR